ncbi:MAG: 30S ribosomal protein S9 [Patescibacteria group bacterium]|nr:30S ribosomal protein S9 [Patescibacteria group bacterium]
MTDSPVKFSGKYYYACGKRKTSIARVRLYKGTGKVIINGKDSKDYLPTSDLLEILKSPAKLVKKDKDFDISAKVLGGGSVGQAEAIRHGVAKALLVFDPELRPALKKAGFITRDSRIKERKKYGLKRARKSPQWSKR